jgi:hypothetical protein
MASGSAFDFQLRNGITRIMLQNASWTIQRLLLLGSIGRPNNTVASKEVLASSTVSRNQKCLLALLDPEAVSYLLELVIFGPKTCLSAFCRSQVASSRQ